jgi:hypothetical protein
MQPNGVRCVKKCPAIQQAEIRKTRMWDNPRQAQPNPDVGREERHEFPVEAGKKRVGFRWSSHHSRYFHRSSSVSKLSVDCHSERSEESLVISGSVPTAINPRCFASLNMTDR